MERILRDTDGNTVNSCPDGHEYLNDLDLMQLQSLVPAYRKDVDDYLFLLISVQILVNKGLLEDKQEYQMQEFLDANAELVKPSVKQAMLDKISNKN
jgi:hypothetical protein